MKNKRTLSNSLSVYFLNVIIILICLGSILFAASNDNINEASLAIVSGIAGSISGAIVTVMSKSTNPEDSNKKEI